MLHDLKRKTNCGAREAMMAEKLQRMTMLGGQSNGSNHLNNGKSAHGNSHSSPKYGAIKSPSAAHNPREKSNDMSLRSNNSGYMNANNAFSFAIKLASESNGMQSWQQPSNMAMALPPPKVTLPLRLSSSEQNNMSNGTAGKKETTAPSQSSSSLGSGSSGNSNQNTMSLDALSYSWNPLCSLQVLASGHHHICEDKGSACRRSLFLDNFFAGCPKCINGPQPANSDCHSSMLMDQSFTNSSNNGGKRKDNESNGETDSDTCSTNNDNQQGGGSSSNGSDSGKGSSETSELSDKSSALAGSNLFSLGKASLQPVLLEIFKEILVHRNLTIGELDDFFILLFQFKFRGLTQGEKSGNKSVDYQDLVDTFKSEIMTHLVTHPSLGYELAIYMQALGYPIEHLPYFKAKAALHSSGDHPGRILSHENSVAESVMTSLGLTSIFSGDLTVSQVKSTISYFLRFSMNILREIQYHLLQLSQARAFYDCSSGHFNAGSLLMQIEICVEELINIDLLESYQL